MTELLEKYKMTIGLIAFIYFSIIGIGLLILVHALAFAAVAWSVRLALSAL